jgi:hypothetical protein
MITDLKRFERRVNVMGVLAFGLLLGVDIAVHTYSGPSIAIGLAVAIGVAVAIALVSRLVGERFWPFFVRCWCVFF